MHNPGLYFFAKILDSLVYRVLKYKCLGRQNFLNGFWQFDFATAKIKRRWDYGTDKVA